MTGLGAARTLDSAHALSEAYVFTPRHLTEWLRSRMGAIGHERLLPAGLLINELGISLPDPSSLALPARDDSAAEPPAERLAGYGLLPAPPSMDLYSDNVLVIRRTHPIVRLPEDPRDETDAVGPFESQSAGRFEMAYELRLLAMRQRENPRPVEGERDDTGSWVYRRERVVLADYLMATATVGGDLVIDFHPSGIGRLPTLRLSVLGEQGANGIAPSLETKATLGACEEVFEGVEAADIERALAEIASQDVTALLTGADDLVRERSDEPPFPLMQRQLLPSTLGFVTACVHRALAPLFTSTSAVGNLMSWQGANYVIADGMVHWPVRVEIDPSALFRELSAAAAPGGPKPT